VQGLRAVPVLRPHRASKPGVLILLGNFRAVLARFWFVTLSSIGRRTYTVGLDKLPIPLNLQLDSISPCCVLGRGHQEDEGKGLRPWELLGEKIKNGYSGARGSAAYLDCLRTSRSVSSAWRSVGVPRFDTMRKCWCSVRFRRSTRSATGKRFLEARASWKVDATAWQKSGRSVDDPPRPCSGCST